MIQHDHLINWRSLLQIRHLHSVVPANHDSGSTFYPFISEGCVDGEKGLNLQCTN